MLPVVNIKRLAGGDKKEWDSFVEGFSCVIYAAVLKTLNFYTKEVNDLDVKEVVQEVFLRLIKNDYGLLRNYNPSKSSLVTWLTIIARSTAVDFLRKAHPHTVPLNDADTGSVALEKPRSVLINIPSGLLSARQKLVCTLLFDKGMDTAQVAELLGIEVQTVRSCKHKAINKLRKLFHAKV